MTSIKNTASALIMDLTNSVSKFNSKMLQFLIVCHTWEAYFILLCHVPFGTKPYIQYKVYPNNQTVAGLSVTLDHFRYSGRCLHYCYLQIRSLCLGLFVDTTFIHSYRSWLLAWAPPCLQDCIVLLPSITSSIQQLAFHSRETWQHWLQSLPDQCSVFNHLLH